MQLTFTLCDASIDRDALDWLFDNEKDVKELYSKAGDDEIRLAELTTLVSASPVFVSFF